MADQRENTSGEAISPIEQKSANSKIESGRADAAHDPARDAEVLKDEQEAMRRAQLPKPDDEPSGAKNREVAEIESIVNAFRH